MKSDQDSENHLCTAQNHVQRALQIHWKPAILDKAIRTLSMSHSSEDAQVRSAVWSHTRSKDHCRLPLMQLPNHHKVKTDFNCLQSSSTLRHADSDTEAEVPVSIKLYSKKPHLAEMPWCKNFNKETVKTALGRVPSLPCQPLVVVGTYKGHHPD